MGSVKNTRKGTILALYIGISEISNTFLAVNVEGYRSQVEYGVPQGLDLGPSIFTLYMLPSREISLGYHYYSNIFFENCISIISKTKFFHLKNVSK